ncbi:hypothetical protein [Neptunomonas antarctica]|uniref:PEP-CTERM protein-sorting domain-containing protein n=1 Tax=Neptunomonas antarctica TaxID=619304 RepID=A0A1N7K3I2_9GAMM|nr:hypothetical protein [Neptunomonas antarctica]SIS56155.1 hypothetical protein SAMN05421760_102174 [Neptunomonas antarctica]
MFKKMLVKKVGLGLFLCGASLFSAVSQGSIIASFDAEVDLKVSSTFLTNEFATELFDNDVFVEGSASGDASGSGDADYAPLGSGEIGSLRAAANGDVTGAPGSVVSTWSTDGYFYIENTTGSAITGDVTFDISWSANIFTDSLNEEALAYAAVYIEDSYFNVIFDDFIEFDSLIEGAGSSGLGDSFTVQITDLTLAAWDFEEYYIAIDAAGFAEVPEPGGIFLAGLALLLMMRKCRTNQQPLFTRFI